MLPYRRQYGPGWRYGVENHLTIYGDEAKLSGHESTRKGMDQATNQYAHETAGLVTTNCLIVGWSGVYKVNIGVNDNRIQGIGKAMTQTHGRHFARLRRQRLRRSHHQ
ncbi:hypothetical protein M0805_009215 [Coniferiporia weirii]|nr:hypothetical protein M0805_009215 [Coniferiporia weirii]